MSIKAKKKSRKVVVNEKRNSLTAAITDMEQNIGDGSLGQEKGQGYDSPCHIVIHSLRRRLADADGISGKAAIDGLIHSGVLRDDSPQFVKSVTFSQEKTDGPEKTIIRIY